MNKVEEALAYHKQGYNCAQAVACVFAEELGIEEKEIFRMSEGFGFGMGTMGTCGAVSGMAIVAGLLNSDGNLKRPRSKPQTYKVTRTMSQEFQEKNSSIICKELKSVDTGEVLRSCSGCIADAVAIAEEYVKEKGAYDSASK